MGDSFQDGRRYEEKRGILNRNLFTALYTKEWGGGGGVTIIYLVNPLSLFYRSNFSTCAAKASTIIAILKHQKLQPKKMILNICKLLKKNKKTLSSYFL